MVRRITFSLLLALMVCEAAGAGSRDAGAQDRLPVHLAALAPPRSEDVPNFHQVTTNLYRSGQPGETGFRLLAEQYGIRTVISLRTIGQDEPLTLGLGLRLLRFPLHAATIERDRKNIIAALRALRTATKQAPTLLHCEHGSDRTGLITALYRILYQNWSKAAALQEMQGKAYGFHTIWGNIPRFVQELDVAQFRREVGMS